MAVLEGLGVSVHRFMPPVFLGFIGAALLFGLAGLLTRHLPVLPAVANR